MIRKYLARRKLKRYDIALEVFNQFIEEHGKDRPMPQTFRKWVKKMQVTEGLKL